MEADNNNLRRALRRCLDHGETERVVDAGWTLWLFWWIHAHLGEGRRLMDETLRAGGLSELSAAKAIAVKGCMAFWQTDYAEGIALLSSALETMRAHDYKSGVALCQLPLGFADAAMGEAEGARGRYEESIRFFKEMGDEWGTVISLNAYAWMSLGGGIDPGPEIFEQAVERGEKLGTQLEYGMALRNLGGYRARKGDMMTAKELLSQALRALWHGSNRGGTTYTIEGIAEVAAEQGAVRVATRLFAAVDAVRAATGSTIIPMFATRFERFVADLRAQLGDEEFEREWAGGRGLGMPAAVELALSWAEGTTPDVPEAPAMRGFES
jgi:hypothetical protein